MGLGSWLKKIRNKFQKKEDVLEGVPENWLKQDGPAELVLEPKRTVRVIYEEKKTPLYIARKIKRFFCGLMIIVNLVLLGTSFFVQGGMMIFFFILNAVFLSDYFWKTRSRTEEGWQGG